jgi:oligosaccharyltransferase complex subunit epsilon
MSSNIAIPKIPTAQEAQQQASAVQSQLSNSLSTLVHNYSTTTPARVKLIDTFLLFCVLSGVLQFAYRILVTSFPYYAFVGG